MITEQCCRVSGLPLRPLIDFGMQPLGNGFVDTNEFDEEYYFPMTLGFCEESRMAQLLHQPEPERMFHENYAFFSSTSTRMMQHFQDLADSVLASDYLSKADPFVIEMGCNDGVLLKHFAARDIRHLGIEPSENVARVANEAGVSTISEFFSEALAERIVDEHGQADIFMSANVMCHIPDIVDVVKGIHRILKPSGVVIFEDPYLGDIITKTSYDQIYDEHVFLFSAISVQHLFGQNELELIDVLPQSTHGGSMRYVLAHAGAYSVRESVTDILEREKDLGLDSPASLQPFCDAVEQSRHDLLELLQDLKKQGKRVAGYAATSKSTTILNYCGIGPDLIEYICDTTPIKQGKFTPGMHIPVLPYEHFCENPPDYAVLFAWNHAEEILAKETGFTKSGGKWIVHVPQVRVF